MHVLIECFRTIEARPDQGNTEHGTHEIAYFLNGMIYAFDFTPMDYAAQVVVRTALGMHAKEASKSARFEALLTLQLLARPFALQEWFWSRRTFTSRLSYPALRHGIQTPGPLDA